MGKPRPIPDYDQQVVAYRDLAREALDSVAVYNARAQWFGCSGNHTLSTEYRQLSREALERAQRYKDLADLAENHLKPLRFETLRGKHEQASEPTARINDRDSDRNTVKKRLS